MRPIVAARVRDSNHAEPEGSQLTSYMQRLIPSDRPARQPSRGAGIRQDPSPRP